MWSAAEAANALSLPTFNAYPQLPVTTAGEYLMMLPQQLEGLLTDEAAAGDESELDSEWIEKVCVL